MRRRPWLTGLVGAFLLVLAVAAALLARGVADAASSFERAQAEWQRGVVPAPLAEPGAAEQIGESLLGVHARHEVLRAYATYRAGLADVIEGTQYPQTRARFEAVERLGDLRSSLDSPSDRAALDVAVGAVHAASIGTSGGQREQQGRRAIEAFTRAALADPQNEAAKLDLELLFRREIARSSADARQSSAPNRRRQAQQDPRGPTPPSSAGGAGF